MNTTGLDLKRSSLGYVRLVYVHANLGIKKYFYQIGYSIF